MSSGPLDYETVSQERNQYKLAAAGLLIGFLFDSEDGADIFLRNVELCPNYTALQLSSALHSQPPSELQIQEFVGSSILSIGEVCVLGEARRSKCVSLRHY
jgi:hypothetical protein